MPFKPIFSTCLVAALAAASLAGCASFPGGHDHGDHHPGRSANATASSASGAPSAHGGMMGGGMTGSAGGMQPMSKDEMCAMYRNMRDAPNDEARQDMMKRDMPAMSAEMRQRHMEMLRQHCQ